MFTSKKYVDQEIEKSIKKLKLELVQKQEHLDEQLHIYTNQTDYKNDMFFNSINQKHDKSIEVTNNNFEKLNENFDKLQKFIESLNIDLLKIEENQNDINEKIDSLRTDIDILGHEKPDLNPVFDKILELDNQTLEHFKIVHDTISKLSEIVMVKSTQKLEKPSDQKASYSYSPQKISNIDHKLKSLDDQYQDLKLKLETAIEVIFEKISESDDENLPSQLLGDKCPFKKKQGFCELWAKRKNKKDALVYCSSCMQASELLDKGVSL